MPYHHGTTLINSKLRFDFSNLNPKYGKKEEELFDIEIKIYCNGKKMAYVLKNNYINISINDAIRRIFVNEIEKKFIFYADENYNVKVKVFREKDLNRPKYIKTSEIIKTKRRVYLMKEEINLYYDSTINESLGIKLGKRQKKERIINHFN